MLKFQPMMMMPMMIAIPSEYQGGLLFLVPMPPGGISSSPGMFYIYKPDQLLVLAPATILEGFGRQP